MANSVSNFVISHLSVFQQQEHENNKTYKKYKEKTRREMFAKSKTAKTCQRRNTGNYCAKWIPEGAPGKKTIKKVHRKYCKSAQLAKGRFVVKCSFPAAGSKILNKTNEKEVDASVIEFVAESLHGPKSIGKHSVFCVTLVFQAMVRLPRSTGILGYFCEFHFS